MLQFLLVFLAFAGLAVSSPWFSQPLVPDHKEVSASPATAVSLPTTVAISTAGSPICPDGFGKIYTTTTRDAFTAECSTDFSHGEDLAIILNKHALEDCLQSCSAYNQGNPSISCIGATFYKPYNACYLKSTAHNSYKQEHTDSGILVSKASGSSTANSTTSTGPASSSATDNKSTSEIASATSSEGTTSTSSTSSSSVSPTSRFANCPRDDSMEYMVPEGDKYTIHCNTDLLGFSIEIVSGIYSLAECLEECSLYTKAKCVAVVHDKAQRKCDLKVQLEDSLWTEAVDGAVLIPTTDPAGPKDGTSGSSSAITASSKSSSSTESSTSASAKSVNRRHLLLQSLPVTASSSSVPASATSSAAQVSSTLSSALGSTTKTVPCSTFAAASSSSSSAPAVQASSSSPAATASPSSSTNASPSSSSTVSASDSSAGTSSSSSSSTVSASDPSTGTSSSSSSAATPSASSGTGSYVFTESNATDACTAFPLGSGFVPYPDTAETFREYEDFSVIAQTAQPPSGYVQMFSDFKTAVRGRDGRGVHVLTAYDTITCAEICDDTKDCNAFNLYIERDPTLRPARRCPNPASTTNYICSLWRLDLAAKYATDGGALLYQFQEVVRGSNAYNKFQLDIT